MIAVDTCMVRYFRYFTGKQRRQRKENLLLKVTRLVVNRWHNFLSVILKLQDTPCVCMHVYA